MPGVHSPLRYKILLAIGGWLALQYQGWFPSCWAGIKYKQTTVGYYQDRTATIV